MANKMNVEEIFGKVSDFHGAFGTAEKKVDVVPHQTEERIPHWHDSCFTGGEVQEAPVREEDLCSHF